MAAQQLTEEDNTADEEDDARVMAIFREPPGFRHRCFRDAVHLLVETSWVGWPLAGPRTLLWCARFILEVNGTPRARFSKWLHECQLTLNDPLVAEYENAMRCLEISLTYDQLMSSELACLELMMRRAQLCEVKYKERLLEGAGLASDTHVFEDSLFAGHREGMGMVMICPSLRDFVTAELAKESS